jgi:UDP-3-O-[3-hydroxymyristoyl] N-acetylglucosamine deacetylase
MINQWQSTVKKKISFVGKGLHSGRIVKLDILPARADTGIVFQRTDSQRAQPVRADALNVTSTRLNTTIGHGPSSVSTIEHLMAAFAGLGIHNALVQLNGPELPILDGSAKPFIEHLAAAGTARLNRRQIAWQVKQPFEWRCGDQYVKVLPSNRQRVKCSIDFPHAAIGFQSIDYRPNRDQFLAIAQARTFCHFRDVNQMRERGLALGGSLDNAIVVDDQGVMNEEGLRSPLEFVQHKLLDLIGDLSLLGAPIWGDVIAYKPGHQLHADFMKAALEQFEQVFEPIASGDLIPERTVKESDFDFRQAIATYG